MIEPGADIHEVRAANGSVAVAAAVGFGWSEDGGKSWSWNTDRRWHALLDRQVVICLDDGEVMTVGELPGDDGQSLAVLADGTVVVGRTGARLAIVGAQVEEVPAFEQVPDRDHWKNPANPTPDTRSRGVSPNGSRATSTPDTLMLPAVVSSSVSVKRSIVSEDDGESWQVNKVPGVITAVRLGQN